MTLLQDSTIRTLLNGEIVAMETTRLIELARAYDRVLVDLGTGDGQYPYRCARADARLLCVGVDATPNQMVALSRKAVRKPKQGGAENFVIVVSAAAALPETLRGLADKVTVNFPWASLLRDLTAPDAETLRVVRRLLKPDGVLEALLNMQVLGADDVRLRLELPEVTPAYVDEVLRPAYAACALELLSVTPIGPNDLSARTTWGQHLTRNSKRETTRLVARAMKTAP